MADVDANVNDLTISWVRHAESFSNLIEGNLTDFYDFMKKTGGKRPLTNLKNNTWVEDKKKKKHKGKIGRRI